MFSLHLLVAGFFWCLAFFIAYFFLSGFIWGAGFQTTPRRDIEIASKLMELKEGMVVYDLGAGTGNVVCYLAKKYKVKCVGVEVDPFKAFLCKLRVSRDPELKEKVQIVRKNLFAVDLSKADAVYLFLSGGSGIMKRLRPKLASELRPGVKIASYFHLFPGIEASGKTGNIRVYTGESLSKAGKVRS